MKKILFSLLLTVSLLFVSNTASAGIPIFYSDGLKFATTHQLPDTILVDDVHVNFGVSFNQFAIMWVPMWNYGKTEYVLITNDKETAYELDEEELLYIKEEFGISTDKEPQIPFWDKTGGKLIWGALLLSLIIWGYIPSKKGEDEEVTENEEESTEEEESEVAEDVEIE